MHNLFILKTEVMRVWRQKNEPVERSVLASVESGAAANERRKLSRLFVRLSL